jgi:hypothetical protein
MDNASTALVISAGKARVKNLKGQVGRKHANSFAKPKTQKNSQIIEDQPLLIRRSKVEVTLFQFDRHTEKENLAPHR